MRIAGDDHIPKDDLEVMGGGIHQGSTNENWNRGIVLAKHFLRESGRALTAAKDAFFNWNFRVIPTSQRCLRMRLEIR